MTALSRMCGFGVTCELTLPGGADPLSVVLAGTTPEARRRFTHVAVRGCGFNGPHLLQALAAQLPSLTVLEVSGGDSKAVTTGICSNMPATYLARLQRLDLELQTEADMASVGALAACHQLRDLKLTAGLSQQRIPRVSQASGSVLGDALSQLQSLGNLQHLALRCFILDDYGDIPLCVLGSRRPPNLRNLELEISEYRGGEPTLAVVYERGLVSSKVATAAAGGGWGMRRIQLSQGWGGQLDELAAALLAVADGLRQRIIPELVVQGTWSLPPSSELLEPEAPLPRLLARCAQVEVEGELLAYGADSASTLLAAFRLMGLLPHVLWLQHGEWRSREAASAGGAATASAAAATCTSEGAQPDLLASQLQQRRLGRC
ncbi:hypothetical protein CHLRE_17g703650v5 [Chlamydomonas reinhardtii]|uniref:Uncharacterized protein n=1 Tax=Chlamydomonas reinhardtii TaxID=3055 RepID=A0A2K3CP40_CHLRE|nr:uncharacterized protein CHLRE_17g703650v5 [Chlamydomonas reinhardtii]PNW70052.1 hypothetical protein CHLRE_17g703650v5 [Chlamydomonas reinhardtii]